MDGWSRPNHMRNHLDALQTTTSVGLRRVPDSFHSVAKQALFYVALGADFEGFGKPKWSSKLDFGRMVFDLVFDCVLASISGGCLEARNLKKTTKTILFSMCFANFHQIGFFESVDFIEYVIFLRENDDF